METRLKENHRPMRLLIVDAVAHSRDSLAAYLHLQERLQVVGQTATAAAAVYLTQQHRPDVVIVDVNLPGTDGFAVTRRLLALDAPPAVILLTIHRRAQDLLQAQEAGAVACIEKSAGVDAILDALCTLSKTIAKEGDHG
jgi:DNA-binding NarL/FixJ family response regulator